MKLWTLHTAFSPQNFHDNTYKCIQPLAFSILFRCMYMARRAYIHTEENIDNWKFIQLRRSFMSCERRFSCSVAFFLWGEVKCLWIIYASIPSPHVPSPSHRQWRSSCQGTGGSPRGGFKYWSRSSDQGFSLACVELPRFHLEKLPSSFMDETVIRSSFWSSQFTFWGR